MQIKLDDRGYPLQFKTNTAKNTTQPNLKNEGYNEKDLFLSIRKDPNVLGNIDQNTGYSLLHTLVANNYERLISYITAKDDISIDIINQVCNGQTPLDMAQNDNTKSLLRSRGAKKASELPEDAKIVAAKLSVVKPIKASKQVIKPNTKKTEEAKPVNAEPKAQQKAEATKPNYFDSFDEIEEVETENVENIEVNKENKEEGENAKTNEEKPIEKKEIKIPDSYKNYALLEIEPSEPDSLDKIIGLNDIKQELNENVVIPLNKPEANVTLKANDINMPNGILLDSVTNATTLIKALSSETNMPALQLFNPSELTPMMNDIEKNFKETGNRTIIFIQGFDKYFKGCSCNPLEEQNFRLKMKNCNKKGALIIATVADRSEVCKDFFESGVFDKVLESKKPSIDDRKTYLNQYCEGKHLFRELNKPENIDLIADITEGFTYSDLKRILAEGARTAIANSQDNVSVDLLKQEIETFAKEAGITPINELNKTAIYDTPEFSRIPVVEGEVMSLEELGGMPEVKKRLRDLYVKPMEMIDVLREELGSSAIPDGAIFYGPAGNGKTFTAKVLARELGLPFYETKLSDIGTALVHEEGKAFKKLAKQLNDKYNATGEMSVWFLDEFDSLGKNRAGSHSHNKELTDALLQELNNPSSRGYILIAATNHLEDIDPALRRRGRLGNWIEFKQPNNEERLDLIKKELAKSKLTKELSESKEVLDYLVKEFDGSSVANIVMVINDAKRLTLLENRDFKTAIKECLDINIKREMGEFCGKAGLKQHEFSEASFKSLDELGGMDEVREQLQENIIDTWNPEIRAALIANKRSLPGGVILEGPPGTGKTTIIETLSREMDVPLYKMNYSQDGNEYIHGVARNVTDIFQRLALQSKILKKPVMLFFDEAEKFFPRFANNHQIEEVNTYKELMNNASANGIILIGATNHIDQVNQEIIGNPRRMGTVIHCGNPDENSRKSLFSKLLSGLPIMEKDLTEEDLTDLAFITAGYSIGEIANIVDKAITQAIKKKSSITVDKLLTYFKEKIPHSTRI